MRIRITSKSSAALNAVATVVYVVVIVLHKHLNVLLFLYDVHAKRGNVTLYIILHFAQ